MEKQYQDIMKMMKMNDKPKILCVGVPNYLKKTDQKCFEGFIKLLADAKRNGSFILLDEEVEKIGSDQEEMELENVAHLKKWPSVIKPEGLELKKSLALLAVDMPSTPASSGRKSLIELNVNVIKKRSVDSLGCGRKRNVKARRPKTSPLSRKRKRTA